jgi:hypothetical protein
VSPCSVEVAARNNAEWCDIVCATHANPGVFATDAWTAPRRSPQYYPDAVTLDRFAASADLLSRVDAGAGCSIKDSFAGLDLAPEGFRVLFDAEWICRTPARVPAPSDATRWRVVESTPDFVAWTDAWSESGGSPSPLRPELLAQPDVVVIADATTHITAGAILNRNAGVVGLSNLFTNAANRDEAWNEAVIAASARFGDQPIVGYEAEDDLAAAQRVGFVSIGPLRVWINDGL